MSRTKVDHPVRVCDSCGALFKPKRSDTTLCRETDCVRDRLRVIQHRSYLKHRPRRTEDDRKWYRDNPTHILCINAKRRARKFGVAFDIGPEDVYIPEFCPILKTERLVRHTRYAPSLDRKDNSKGYIKGNVWVISLLVNTMKNSATPEQLKEFGEWASNWRP